MNQYRLRAHSLTIPGRIHRMTVLANDADSARVIARIRNPDFGTTLPGKEGLRLVGRVEPVEPEQADGMTQAKAREFVEWRGTEVEVVG